MHGAGEASRFRFFSPPPPRERLVLKRMMQPDTMQPDNMDAENIMPSPAAPAPTSGACESNDTRDRRIASGKLYSTGVASWRNRQAATTGPAEERSSTARARVFVRVRPLFEHEADRGEWECVSTGEWATRCTWAPFPKHDPKRL